MIFCYFVDLHVVVTLSMIFPPKILGNFVLFTTVWRRVYVPSMISFNFSAPLCDIIIYCFVLLWAWWILVFVLCLCLQRNTSFISCHYLLVIDWTMCRTPWVKIAFRFSNYVSMESSKFLLMTWFEFDQLLSQNMK